MKSLCIAVCAGLVLVVSASAYACEDKAAKSAADVVGSAPSESNRSVTVANKPAGATVPVRWDAVDPRTLEKSKQTSKKGPLPADTPAESQTKSR